MANEIRPDYDSIHLFPPVLEDWVPADHPARFIRDFVDALDLEDLEFKARMGRLGGQGESREELWRTTSAN